MLLVQTGYLLILQNMRLFECCLMLPGVKPKINIRISIKNI